MLTTYTPSTRPNLPNSTDTRDVSPLEELVGVILLAVEKGKKGLAFFQEIADARKFLDSLPFATGEYGLAKNRLGNAHRYLISGEFGAAIWELSNLRRGLIRLA